MEKRVLRDSRGKTPYTKQIAGSKSSVDKEGEGNKRSEKASRGFLYGLPEQGSVRRPKVEKGPNGW